MPAIPLTNNYFFSADLDANKAVVRELLDKTGERKFVKTKLDQYANTFLSDKTTYILSYYL